MIDGHEELLKELAQDDFHLREQAEASIKNGMQKLVDTRRMLQKISVNEEEKVELGLTIYDLMVAGNALRTSLQAIKTHHQRAETPWIDNDGGINLVFRNSMEFENNVDTVLGLIQDEMKKRRREMRKK